MWTSWIPLSKQCSYQALPTSESKPPATTTMSVADSRSYTSTKKSRRAWYTYVWDTWDKPVEERKFLAKLDACVITYAALSYFSKYLNQQNITNAYVSGMQEDLGLHGNQLNYITAAWTVGYVVGQIPSQMLLTRIRPGIWIPAMELLWSLLTLTLTWTNGYSMLCAMRFFIGCAEATFYPAMQYVIGSWYKGEELGKRACIFHTASALGPMVSGFLQTAAYDGLNGVHGMAGWRWLFVCDAALSIPIALIGFLIMPDIPTVQRPNWLYSEKEIMIGQKRMKDAGRKPPGKLTKAKFFGFFKTWQLYVFVALYTCFNNSGGAANSMIFWLKSFNTRCGCIIYTVGQINIYPIPIYAVQIVTTFTWAWWSDAVKARWPPIVFAGIWGIIVDVNLAASPVYDHIGRRWAFYYMTLVQGGLSGIILAWANESTGFNNELRAFTVAACNTFTYAIQAWLPIVIFPQVDQPTVFVGNVTSAVISFFMIFFALVALYLERRDRKRTLQYAGAERELAEVEDIQDGVALGEDDADSKKAVVY